MAVDGGAVAARENLRERLSISVTPLPSGAVTTGTLTPEVSRFPREEKREKAVEQRMANISKYFINMTEKLDAAIKRLEGLAGRIETRLAKMKAKGKDTTALETSLAAARTDLAKAKTDLEQAKVSFQTVTSSKTPKTVFISVKKIVNEVWTTIKGVHASLVKIITQMKGMSEESKTEKENETEPSGRPTEGLKKRLKITITPGISVTPLPSVTPVITITPRPTGV